MLSFITKALYSVKDTDIGILQVLHATRNIDNTLANTRKLLRP